MDEQSELLSRANFISLPKEQAQEQAPEPAIYRTGIDTAVNSPAPKREITITPLSSGYVVKVGCQSIAVETTERLVKHLGLYLADPNSYERKWMGSDKTNKFESFD